MRIESNDAWALKAVIENDLLALARIKTALEPLQGRELGDAETITVAFHLHNAYNALENSFDQISRSFENHVKDLSRWHHELLSKMFLDLTPIRPAVLPRETQSLLRALKGFRHVFRHSYDSGLNSAKVRALLDEWLSGSAAVIEALRHFAALLAADVEGPR